MAKIYDISTAGSIMYIWRTRPINRLLYSWMFKDPLDTKINLQKETKLKKTSCFMLKVRVFH